MWLPASVLCLSCLLPTLRGQDGGRASLRRSGDHSGRCQYTFTVASPEGPGCPAGDSGAETEALLSRLTLLEAQVGRLVGGGEGGPAGAGAGDAAGLGEAYARVTGERDQLRQDKEHLNRQVRDLMKRVDELSLETEALKQKPCRPSPDAARDQPGNSRRPASNPANNVPSASYQEMKAEVTEVPASFLLPDGGHNQTGCGELVAVGDPVLHRKADSITGKYGVWLQDPEPRGLPYTNKTVWRIDAVGRDVRQLFAYEDMEQFSRGFPMKVLVLPEAVESTGAALYRGSLYFQRRLSRTLIRFDLASESPAARLDLPHAGFHGQHPYSWGGYTDIDLAVDEQGLWAIYSTSKAKGAVVISKLDPDSLEVKRSWETKIRKNSVGNAFMVCGRLYTVASYTAPNTTINHVFDTATGAGRAIAVPFKNKYRYNSMVDYNHAQRKLFSWDNHHMTTYDVTLGAASPGSS